MPTTSVTALTGTLLTGKTTFGPITPPIGISSVQVAIDRAGLLLLTQPISWAAEISLDAGATWMACGGGACPAGTITHPLTLVVWTESSFTQPLPFTTDANTRVRGEVTTLEPLTTTVTVRMT